MGGQVSDVGDVDFDDAVADVLEEVGGVVEDAQGTCDPECGGPGLQLLRFGVLVVAIECDDIVGEDFPKTVHKETSDLCGVQPSPHCAETIIVTPDAWAEPGQEPNTDQLLQLLLERRDEGRRHPTGSVARLPDDPINLNTSRCVRVCSIISRFGAANDNDVVRLERLLGALVEIFGMVDWGVEGVTSGQIRYKGLRSQAGRDDKLVS